MRRILSVAAALLLVFSMTACRQVVFVPFPEDPGAGTISAEDVGSGFDMDQLALDIQKEVNGEDVMGLDADVSTAQPAISYMSGIGGARNSAIPDTVYITVTFDGYRNSESTLIQNGMLFFAANGTVSGDTLELESYKAEPTGHLTVITTAGSISVTSSVQLNIPYAQIKGSVVFSASGTVESITVTLLSAPADHSGATITVGREELPMDQVEGVAAGFGGLFAGGYGTAESPYQISNTRQFLNLGSDDVQEMMLRGENDNLYFELTGDIDLKGHSGIVAEFFAGTLRGNNHVIHGSNRVEYIFLYYFENATFEDFTIEFDDSDVTLLVMSPAFIAEGSFDSDGDTNYIAEDDSIRLTYENVDYRVPDNSTYYYPVRDNNFGFYADGTVPVGYAVINGEIAPEIAYTYAVVTSDGSRILHEINIFDCDVSGNFIGGFSNSGSAIFIGGQNFDTVINLDNCSFDGTLTGANTSLLVANANMSYPNNPATFPYECNVTANNVRGGNIVSYSGASSLHFSNSKTTSEIEGTVTGNYEILTPADAIQVTDVEENQQMVISPNIALPGCEKYQVKLSLPTLYWYDKGVSGGVSGETNSNTFTIEYGAEEATAIYVAKPITKIEADALVASVSEFGSIDWASAAISEEGHPYSFVQVDGYWYLVIDYGTEDTLMYSDSGLPESLDGYSYLRLFIVLAMDSNNNVVGTSTYSMN